MKAKAEAEAAAKAAKALQEVERLKRQLAAKEAALRAKKVGCDT
jgi:hypothetical protein